LKARVRILSYREEKASIGPIEFTSLRVVGERTLEEPVELGDDIEATLEKLARELGNGDYVEAVAETKAGVIRVGVSVRGDPQQGSSLLFHRPSRLIKIGIVTKLPRRAAEDIEGHQGSEGPSDNAGRETAGEGSGAGEAASTSEGLSEDNIVWYTPQDAIYIFEGQVTLREPCEAVIFLTEDGEKIYTGSGEVQVRRIVRRVRRRSRKAKRRK